MAANVGMARAYFFFLVRGRKRRDSLMMMMMTTPGEVVTSSTTGWAGADCFRVAVSCCRFVVDFSVCLALHEQLSRSWRLSLSALQYGCEYDKSPTADESTLATLQSSAVPWARCLLNTPAETRDQRCEKYRRTLIVCSSMSKLTISKAGQREKSDPGARKLQHMQY